MRSFHLLIIIYIITYYYHIFAYVCIRMTETYFAMQLVFYVLCNSMFTFCKLPVTRQHEVWCKTM